MSTPVILRSAATKNLCDNREGKILRCAQDDSDGADTVHL